MKKRGSGLVSASSKPSNSTSCHERGGSADCVTVTFDSGRGLEIRAAQIYNGADDDGGDFVTARANHRTESHRRASLGELYRCYVHRGERDLRRSTGERPHRTVNVKLGYRYVSFTLVRRRCLCTAAAGALGAGRAGHARLSDYNTRLK
ncbi:hypothetical protein EVAR_27549_1 [Eumeta japonica]|uniref:Uncharacterized protein n=1 Tax=Eumeta variegata TaxID=151549 RepID=A0A4C1WAT0_EUMVA|nr:hypothetical protein EVAR_27549_1 [Eumeta japonica]